MEVDLDSKALKEAHNAIFSQIPESTNTIVKSTTLPESDEKVSLLFIILDAPLMSDSASIQWYSASNLLPWTR